MKRAVLVGLVLGALAAPSAQAGTIGEANYVQHWYEAKPRVVFALCDSTPTWQHRRFPIYCWIGYKSGRWSDYRVRLSHGRPYAKRISTGQWEMTDEICTTPAAGTESCRTERVVG